VKLYLSSFRIGGEPDTLVSFVAGRTIALIPNALDFVEPAGYEKSTAAAVREVQDLGIDVELLDLKEYFGRERDLEAILQTFGGVWVRGGNTFVLRQAMRLSGFDHAIHEMPADFVYGGYSAGICVLAPDSSALQIGPSGVRGYRCGGGVL
jgi:dipeptidase E